MPKPVSSSGRFRKSGLACSLLAVAAGTTAVMTANAQIVYSGLQDLSVNVTSPTNSISSIPIDLTGSGSDDFNLVGYLAGSDLGRLTNFVSGFEAEDSSGGKIGPNADLIGAGISVGSSGSKICSLLNPTGRNLITSSPTAFSPGCRTR